MVHPTNQSNSQILKMIPEKMDGTIGNFPAIYMETGIQNVWLSIWDYPGGGALGFEHGGLGAQRKGEVGEVVASEGPVYRSQLRLVGA